MRKFRICLLCDTLSLGGVETHVVTLANLLAREGHTVTVISGGGALVASLSGVTHITLPLERKRKYPSLLVELRRLFKRERFDVVHAHTRFSAFLCRPIVRERLVTTAHWVFDTRFPKGALTTWGDETLAVSTDIASYLTKNYKLNDKHVTVTVNGIDTQRFVPKKHEKDKIKIVYCSRLDRDRADVAFLLLDAIKELPMRDFSLHVLGTGDRFSEFKDKADVLYRHSELSLRIWGGVTDVASHLADADIVIGVSRAALEGMSAGAAVILAGNEGYLSIFRPQNDMLAKESNFCCRGAEKASKDALVRDLSYLLALPREQLLQMGTENRHYVEKNYGEHRMAKDALSVYERICKRRVVLCGYYGFSNIGDELLLHAFRERLSREGYGRICLFSAKKRSLSALRALKHGYDFILGGGNLLQDATSKRSLLFYLFIAARANGYIEIHGGFGPLSPAGEEYCRPLLSKASAILCRTTDDLKTATRLGGVHARLSADMVLALDFPQKKKGKKVLLAFKAPHASDIPAALAFILSLCRIYGKENCVLFVMHPTDLTFSRRAAKLASIPFLEGDPKAFLALLAECRAVYSSRLHAGVAALGIGVPFALWEGENKNRFFINDLKSMSDSDEFCALFSFSEPPPRTLNAAGIKEAKKALLHRL